jgi:predicted transposase/invertase (TIGR01784 family)
MHLLDPKKDIVFKLLFAAPRHESLLIAFLTDVLCPTHAITSAKVLNPEVPKDFTSEKAVLLDVRATLSDGRLVDVEMQARRDTAFRERVLFYWARHFGSQLNVGEKYRSVAPCVGVYVLDFADLQGQDFHSVFQLSNPRTREVLSNALEMHFLELPKLPAGTETCGVYNWGRFFRVRSESELEQLAMTSPTMKQASDALWWVSNDPSSRQLVEERELAEWAYQHTMAATHEEGRQQGREEGRQQGREEGQTDGLRKGLQALCRALAIELDAQKLARLATLDADALESLSETLVRNRKWPE